jgi:hypothetical protein
MLGRESKAKDERCDQQGVGCEQTLPGSGGGTISRPAMQIVPKNRQCSPNGRQPQRAGGLLRSWRPLGPPTSKQPASSLRLAAVRSWILPKLPSWLRKLLLCRHGCRYGASREIECWESECRSFDSIEKHFQDGFAELQIPPLRYAPVGMTMGRVVLSGRID